MNPDQPAESRDRNGEDLDIWGGMSSVPLLIPDPHSGQVDCLLKDDQGRCPPACQECERFREEWARPQRPETGRKE
jgi:hypothetical protein